MPHVFFLSYARNDSNRFSKLDTVIEALEQRVADLLGSKPPIAFVDVSSIDTGQKWEDLISRAVHESPVLVCMLSVSYVSSEWCAKEFDVFRRRLEAAPADTRPSVIPVLWDIRRDEIPSVLRQFEDANNKYPEEYERSGLRSLRLLKKLKDEYILTIDELARAIHRAAQRQLPPLNPSIQFAKLPRAFDNPGKYSLAVCSLHPSGPQWRIDPSGAKTLGRVIDDVARNMKVPWRDVAPEDIRAAIDSDRAAVVVIVPGDIATNPALLAQLTALDASNPPKLGMLIASDDESLVRLLAPTLGAGAHLVETFPPARLDVFIAKLGTFAERLRSERVQADAPVSRIADATVQQAADAAGVPISTRPSLAGPGGAA